MDLFIIGRGDGDYLHKVNGYYGWRKPEETIVVWNEQNAKSFIDINEGSFMVKILPR